MATVVSDMSMSLDGFIAGPDDRVDEVFAWYSKPQPEPSEPTGGERTPAGVIVYGRRSFELANGWGGNHPMGVPVIVVTHEVPEGWPREGSTISFVTDGLESAIEKAKEIAGDKLVAVGSPDIAQQCLNAGLLDAIRVSLTSVLLGDGIPYFDKLADTPVELEGPTVTAGNGVVHLYYEVRR
jgi:dihydrofolate reductase